ncbi:MAG TPA: hypothetical protein VND22_01955, partial [Actinomycetota bacterium]|nr:hypothetical protein [Actinomycetota bacterium]
DHARGALLTGAAHRLLDEIGAKLSPHLVPLIEEATNSIKQSAGGDFESLIESGKSMSPEDAITLAMEG